MGVSKVCIHFMEVFIIHNHIYFLVFQTSYRGGYVAGRSLFDDEIMVTSSVLPSCFGFGLHCVFDGARYMVVLVTAIVFVYSCGVGVWICLIVVLSHILLDCS